MVAAQAGKLKEEIGGGRIGGRWEGGGSTEQKMASLSLQIPFRKALHIFKVSIVFGS